MTRQISNSLRKPRHAAEPIANDRRAAAQVGVGAAGSGDRRRSARLKPTQTKKYQPIDTDKASVLWTSLFCLAVAMALAFGARQVGAWQITPKEGAGYYLGIAGGLMMLSLAFYPLRKHSKWLSSIGTVKGWFRAHMILGIIGPALVVIHSGFQLSSQNGSVAMVAMLLVVLSGIFGRYIYARLHWGLYGRRTEISDLIRNIEQTEANIALESAIPVETIRDLKVLADSALATTTTPRGCLEFRARRSERKKFKRTVHTDIQTSISVAALAQQADAGQLRLELDKAHSAVDQYFLTIEQIGSVRLYERLFHLWHLLHMPCFFLLVAAATLHVVAVHLY